MKNRTQNMCGILFLVSLLFSVGTFANVTQQEKEERCVIHITNPTINYGELVRGKQVRDTLGIIELPEREQLIRLSCAESEMLFMSTEGVKRGVESFAFGENSNLNIQVQSLTIDGKNVAFRILRNGQLYNTQALQPGDKVQPYPELSGKNLEMLLSITPNVSTKEPFGGHSLELQSLIRAGYENASTNTFTISANFLATACTPLLSQSVVDYGLLKTDRLVNEGPTVLESKTLEFTITCENESYVAIRASSNRKNSTIDILGGENSGGSAQANPTVLAAGLGKNLPLGLPDIATPRVTGLGIDNKGNAIGGYMLNLPLTHIILDGVAAKAKFWTTERPTSLTTWNKNTSIQPQGDSLLNEMEMYFSYGKDVTSSSPSPFQFFSGTLIIQAYITAKKNLDLSYPIQLDGSTNIELFYF